MKTNRRLFLGGSIASAIGLLLSNDRGARAEEAARAKSLIVLWMNGGPSHVDTFDPKKSGRDAGPFKAIATRAPGVEICEHMPQIADVADKLAIVRSLTSKEGNHDRARYLAHTGYSPNPTVAHPSFGAWVSSEKGGGLALPSFVSVAGPSAGGGFLGVQYAPFVMGAAGKLPENVAHGFGVDDARFTRRRDALAFLDKGFAAATGDPSVKARDDVFGRAYDMMGSKDLAAFDLSGEPEATTKAYGDSDFGRGCLLARRLVEAGTRVVEVTLNGWDTHDNGFERGKKLMADLDPAMATLVHDLAERDLLESTLVLCMGEFGRSPELNDNDGRGHHPKAFSAVLAGGGIHGGIVHGATDARGEDVVDKPVHIADLFATLAIQLGIDPAKSLTAPSGRPISVTENGAAIRALIA